MDFKNIMLSKINQKGISKNHMMHSYVGYVTEAHRHRQQYGKGWRTVKGQGGQKYGDGG